MKYPFLPPPLILALGFVASVSPAASSQDLVRLVVERRPIFSSSATAPQYHPISESAMSAAGFARVADYSSFLLYEGPQATAAALIDKLTNQRYVARLAPELDSISLRGHDVDADSGVASPPYPPEAYVGGGSVGLYIIALRGYPMPDWLAELWRRGVYVVEPLPPSAYLVHGPRSLIEGLRASAGFVRGVFPFTPRMKRQPLTEVTPSATLYRRVVIEAFEPMLSDNIEPYLGSVARPGTLKATARTGARTVYASEMTDLDLLTLSHFESVYAISPVQEVTPSSERQAMLIADPTVGTDGRLTLPTACVNYGNWLATRVSPIPDFSNTRVALVDTGFDDLQSGMHPDFTFNGQPTVIRDHNGTVFNQTNEANEDNMTHGTVVASIVTGWAQFDGPNTADDAEMYRYAHGLAPTVATAMDKYFSATNEYTFENSNPYTRLTNALAALAVWSPHVMNHSWNTSAGYCGYENLSQLLDQHTRTAGVLHVASAGNANETGEGGCRTVRAPATAKNAIAVGATYNFTPTTWLNNSGFIDDGNPVNDYVGVCSWNDPPAAQDARNIPSFSARQALKSVLKPELVAPGARVTGPVTRDSTWEDCVGGVEPPEQDGTCNGIFCSKDLATLGGVRYGFSAGTSFAAPAVTGAAAVARKWFANITGNPTANPSPAMTKAILINGARDIGPHAPNDPGGDVLDEAFGFVANLTNIPNEYQGWGMLNLNRLLDAGTNHYWNDQANVFSATGQSWSVNPHIIDGSRETRITLVWTDRYSASIGGTGGVAYSAVNNLNSIVCLVGGFTCWRGNNWATNGTTLQSSPSGSFSEKINNVEQIVIPAGSLSSGLQIFLSVTAQNLVGDMDPNCDPLGTPPCTTTNQDFALFGSNIQP